MTYEGGVAANYARSLCPGDDELFIALNGAPCDGDAIVRPGDHLCVCAVPAGGNDFWRTVAMIAVMVAAAYTQQHWAYGSIKGILAASAVMVVGGIVVNAAFPVTMPELSALTDANMDRSPNYGWSLPSNAWQEGSALPSLIGERRFAPPRIGGYRHLPADDPKRQRLRMQFAMCEDEIKHISETDIFINDSVITDYPDAIFEYTQGLDDEDFSSTFFQDTVTESAQGTELVEVEEIFSQDLDYTDFTEGVYQPTDSYITIDQDITTFVVNIGMSEKRYQGKTTHTSENGTEYHYAVDKDFRLVVEYRVVGDTDWIVHEDSCEIPYPKYRYANLQKHSVEVYGLSMGQYEVRFTIIGSHGDHNLKIYNIKGYSSLEDAAIVTTSGTAIESVGFGLYFPNGIYHLKNNGSFENHTVRIMYAIRPYGETNWTRVGQLEVTEATNDAFRRFVSFDGLEPNQWECQCFITGVMPTSNRYYHGVVWEYLQEAIDQNFTYPGVAILSVEIPATATLNGQWPTVEVKAKHVDYTTDRSSKNPAWAAYYRMTEKYGYDSSRLIYQDFVDWADFCTTNELTVSGYLDTQLTRKAVI
ncbi:MAG: hypothetical protein PVI54_19555, partial [Desulfobacteraceae bacterium]